MPLRAYIKAYPKVKKPHPKRNKIFFSTLTLLGLCAVVFTAWPFISWQLKTLPRLNSKVESFPIPNQKVLSSGTVLGANVQVVEDESGFSYFETDFKPQGPRPKEFLISVPALGIDKARVSVDDLKFDKHLSHFPGSALPGEAGNSFITGHSVLPQFADSQNYRTIFTKLPDLQIGDDIIVEMNGQTFAYKVQYSKVVSPRDLSVLSPIAEHSKNLTLMTCVPPGTNAQRLVVVTSLI